LQVFARGSRPFVVAILLFALLGSILFVPPTDSVTINVKLTVSKGAQSNTFDQVFGKFPITVGFSVNNSVAGASYFWQFGDGTNSSNPAPFHVFNSPCMYEVQVRTTAPGNGTVLTGTLLFGAFGQTGVSLLICPTQGTAGITPVVLGGAYFPVNRAINVTMDGELIAKVKSNNGGNWVLDLSSILANNPEPNGTVYNFGTYPSRGSISFTTIEGISASPGAGAPGGSVSVVGRSYPPNSRVFVYLGGPSLGAADTDGNGSFSSAFGVPFSPPLIFSGSYQYSTVPAILGSQAAFRSSGAIGTGTQFWWWWILVIIAIILIIIYIVRRSRKRKELAIDEVAAAGQTVP